MPTYEYQCLKCHKKFDYLQKITDKPLANCIYCRGKVERLIGPGAGIIFKGSGFYATDYKKARRGQKAESADASKASQPAASDKRCCGGGACAND